MIKIINIVKLFGRFDYDIATKDGGITIITGPNGFGKSTILQIIDALSHGNVAFFIKLDFKRICVTYDNERKTNIEKGKKTLRIDDLQL